MSEIKVGSLYLLHNGIFQVQKKNGGLSVSLIDYLTGTPVGLSIKNFDATLVKEITTEEAGQLVEKLNRLIVGSTWQLKSDEKIYTIEKVTAGLFCLKEVQSGDESFVSFSDMVQNAIYEVDMEQYTPVSSNGRRARITLKNKAVKDGLDYSTHFIDNGGLTYSGKVYEDIVSSGRLMIL